MTMSNFHDHISHASVGLYVKDMDKSIEFYKKLGFTWYFSVSGFATYLRMKHIYLDLWLDRTGLIMTKLQDESGHTYSYPSLIISVPNLDTLKALNREIMATGIETDARELDNDSSPYGENFRVNDPDGHLIVFRTLKPISSHHNYDVACAQRLLGQAEPTEDIH